MHADSLDHLTHSHAFLGEHHQQNERRTWLVVGLTFSMMVAEIAGGTVFGSLALVADGWHMSTHAAALTISAAAYQYARRHATNPRFAFGTGKLGDLAGYTSAVVLGMIALLIGYQSIERLLHPVTIAYGEATAIAVLGLAVNLISAWLLRGEHHHHDDHDHDHHGQSEDLNLRSAYIHVLADAATSVLAITGLSLAWAFSWRFIDPLVGLAGTAVIGSWAWGLLRDAGRVLVDAIDERPDIEAAVRDCIEQDGDRVTDFHLWQIGPGHLACIVALVSDAPQPPSVYKGRLAGISGLSHVTVEIERCPAITRGCGGVRAEIILAKSVKMWAATKLCLPTSIISLNALPKMTHENGGNREPSASDIKRFLEAESRLALAQPAARPVPNRKSWPMKPVMRRGCSAEWWICRGCSCARQFVEPGTLRAASGGLLLLRKGANLLFLGPWRGSCLRRFG